MAKHMFDHSLGVNQRCVSPLNIWRLILASSLVVIILLQAFTLARLHYASQRSEIHTVVLNWPLQEIQAGNVVSGYVASWKPQGGVTIMAVQVWMGNPSGIFWEGDVYLTLNDRGDFRSPDQVIVHYQFDKHAESSVPHQLWFQIGQGGAGFHVSAGQTVWVWSAFNNFSDKSVKAGDGQVIIYYLA